MTDKSSLIQEEASVYFEELWNKEWDEKRERKALINHTHIVSRNTSRRDSMLISEMSLKVEERAREDAGNGLKKRARHDQK